MYNYVFVCMYMSLCSVQGRKNEGGEGSSSSCAKKTRGAAW